MCLGFADSPLGFFEFQPRSSAKVREGRRGLTGRFPARGSPAARVEGCGSFTGSRRTPGWSWGAGRGSEAAARRSRAAEASDGEGAPVRIGRGETVWELREGEARLMVGDVGGSGPAVAAPRRGGACRGSSGAAVVFRGVGARIEQRGARNRVLG